MVNKLKPVLKWVVTLVGVVGIGVTQGVITGTAAKWSAFAVMSITSAFVWLVPNLKLMPVIPLEETGGSPAVPPAPGG
jgi:hypothetical protein